MKVDHVYNHHNAIAEWQKRDALDWIRDVFDSPSIPVKEGATQAIRAHVRSEFERDGWAINVKIGQDLGLSVFAVKGDLAAHLQTGNVSRVAYDLLKLQHLYVERRIASAMLAVPTKETAAQLGSNVANAERLVNELNLFDRTITVPILVIAFK